MTVRVHRQGCCQYTREGDALINLRIQERTEDDVRGACVLSVAFQHTAYIYAGAYGFGGSDAGDDEPVGAASAQEDRIEEGPQRLDSAEEMKLRITNGHLEKEAGVKKRP